MSIQTEIQRLYTAKNSIKTALVAKGVSVSDTASIDNYGNLVSQISSGGGGVSTLSSEKFNNTFSATATKTIQLLNANPRIILLKVKGIIYSTTTFGYDYLIVDVDNNIVKAVYAGIGNNADYLKNITYLFNNGGFFEDTKVTTASGELSSGISCLHTTVKLDGKSLTVTWDYNGYHNFTEISGVSYYAPSSGGGEPNLQNKTITANGRYTPATGYDGFGVVNVNVSGGGGDVFKTSAIGDGTEILTPTNYNPSFTPTNYFVTAFYYDVNVPERILESRGSLGEGGLVFYIDGNGEIGSDLSECELDPSTGSLEAPGLYFQMDAEYIIIYW